MAEDGGQLGEHVRRRHAGVEERTDHPANQRHVGRGGDSVTGDVADDQRHPGRPEQQPFVPVSADGQGRSGGEVAGRGLDPGQRRQVTEETMLHGDDELVVGVVALRPFDGLDAEDAHGSQRSLQLRVERGRLGPGERERPQHGAVRPVERQRRGGPDAGRDRVRHDLGELHTVRLEVGEQHETLLTYRRRDRVGGVHRNIGVATGHVAVQERVVEQAQCGAGHRPAARGWRSPPRRKQPHGRRRTARPAHWSQGEGGSRAAGPERAPRLLGSARGPPDPRPSVSPPSSRTLCLAEPDQLRRWRPRRARAVRRGPRGGGPLQHVSRMRLSLT